jgi:hypothetical protein
VKYLPLFHHFKGIYHFPKHINFLVKIVANAALINPASILLGGLVGKKYFDVNLTPINDSTPAMPSSL